MRRAHGLESFPLHVTHGHPVPVRRQIAAGLACAILDGRLAPGEALPSTRELARDLRLHRNTVAAAYRTLRDRGFVVSLPRGGARVSRAPPTAGHPGATGLLCELARRAFETGVGRAQLMERLDQWRSGGRHPTLLLIEPRPGLRAVLGAELRARAYGCLRSGDWRSIRRESDVAPGNVVVARSQIARRLATRRPKLWEILPLALSGGSVDLARATSVRLPGVVMLLTRSATVRSFARQLAAGHHAVGLSIAMPDPTDTAAVDRSARIARLVLTDASCGGMAFETRAPVRELHIVSDGTVRRLRRYLGEQTSEGR